VGLVEDALALEDAGIHFLLLEGIPNEVAGMIAQKLSIPVYGIGAGKELDGQLIIIHDILGLFPRFTPKFVKRYCDAGSMIQKAIANYAFEVREGLFPSNEHFYSIQEEDLNQIQKLDQSLKNTTHMLQKDTTN